MQFLECRIRAMGTEALLGAQVPVRQKLTLGGNGSTTGCMLASQNGGDFSKVDPTWLIYCADGFFKVINVEIIVNNGQVIPVATIIPGAELLVEIVPDRYGFSDICSWRWSEQNGCRMDQTVISNKNENYKDKYK